MQDGYFIIVKQEHQLPFIWIQIQDHQESQQVKKYLRKQNIEDGTQQIQIPKILNNYNKPTPPKEDEKNIIENAIPDNNEIENDVNGVEDNIIENDIGELENNVVENDINEVENNTIQQ